jgi:hypothetical protein
LKRKRNVEPEVSAVVRKEEILDRTTSEYEAIVAIAKEARRLNAVPGVYLEKDETAIPKAVENFVGGRVDYVVDGVEGRKQAKKAKKKAAKNRSRKK